MKTIQKTVIFILVIASFTFTQISFADNITENEELIIKAQKLYDKAIGYKSIDANGKDMKALFEQSASVYYTLIEEKDIKNAYLYYNLANCYFHLNEIGKAVFYYRIAKKMNPFFRDINKNLNSARSMVKGYLEGENKESIFRILLFWHYQTSLLSRLWVGVITFILVWLVASLSLFMKKPYFKILIIIFTVICTISFSSVIIQYINENNAHWGVIYISDGADAKEGPGESYDSRFKQNLSEGIEFEVIETKADWYKIKLRNDEVCWIPSETSLTLNNNILFHTK